MTGCEDTGGWRDWLDSLEGELGEGASDWLDRIAYHVLDRARLSVGDTVADLGAGTGLLSIKASRAVGPAGKVLAVDSSEACCRALGDRAAHLGLANIRVLNGFLESLPLESSSCDAAVCRSALIYSDDLAAALLEMKRVLAPGGRFSAFEPLTGEVNAVAMGEGTGLDEEFVLMERTLREKRASHMIDRTMLRRAFEAAGFRDLGSLLMHFTVTMEGRSVEAIRREYLHDLPGDLAAFNVLKNEMEEERILEVVSRFAREASAGRVAVRVPCLLAWGARPLNH
ncbi:MAG: class I SAM-dependent methyltransferase [Candidatus Geothermincolia bacterium]